MEESKHKYCVAIRTLGKAGEMYQKELDSLLQQTIKPEKILVYLAEGYEKPKETVGVEEVIYVKKGMVAQRALPYSEVNTDYCLLLDDDVYLPPDAVEKMFVAMDELNADCVAADTFHNQNMSFFSKIRSAITNWAIPRCDDNWAFKIGPTGSFSYNNSPSKPFYLSQSAAGPCSLWKLSSFKRINFEEELWLDECGFAYGEDLFLFNKLFQNGGRLVVDYSCAAVHLDAQTARTGYKSDSKRLYNRAFCWFMIWYRTQYNVAFQSYFKTFFCLLMFCVKLIWDFALHLVLSISLFSIKPLKCFYKGNRDACQYAHSKDYASIPNFKVK